MIQEVEERSIQLLKCVNMTEKTLWEAEEEAVGLLHDVEEATDQYYLPVADDVYYPQLTPKFHQLTLHRPHWILWAP